jgi:hypothetical protein
MITFLLQFGMRIFPRVHQSYQEEMVSEPKSTRWSHWYLTPNNKMWQNGTDSGTKYFIYLFFLVKLVSNCTEILVLQDMCHFHGCKNKLPFCMECNCWINLFSLGGGLFAPLVKFWVCRCDSKTSLIICVSPPGFLFYPHHRYSFTGSYCQHLA